MKNEHILNLKQVVPIEIRLEVYKEALELFNNKSKVFHNEYDEAFCLLFPCLLWDLSWFLARTPSGDTWACTNTKTAFPEMTPDTFKLMSKIKGEDNKTIQRIKFLEQWIEDLTNQLILES